MGTKLVYAFSIFITLSSSAISVGAELAEAGDPLTTNVDHQASKNTTPSLRDLFACAVGISSQAFSLPELINWNLNLKSTASRGSKYNDGSLGVSILLDGYDHLITLTADKIYLSPMRWTFNTGPRSDYDVGASTNLSFKPEGYKLPLKWLTFGSSGRQRQVHTQDLISPINTSETTEITANQALTGETAEKAMVRALELLRKRLAQTPARVHDYYRVRQGGITYEPHRHLTQNEYFSDLSTLSSGLCACEAALPIETERTRQMLTGSTSQLTVWQKNLNQSRKLEYGDLLCNQM